MARDADFDIVLFGASGFTGRLVAEHLAAENTGLRWALAGRDPGRLGDIRAALGGAADIPILTADVADETSLRAMVRRSRSIISTVGPYQLHGSGLVAACADIGTDYLDLCGEPAWMRRMIETHEDRARQSGARILFSCGFDSLPFELGVRQLQAQATERWGRPLPLVKARVRGLQGGLSGGTAASLRASLAAGAADPATRTLLEDPFALTPGFRGPEQPDWATPRLDPDLGAWVGPFIMSAINAPNIHRSNLLQGHPYGRDFRYDEAIVTGAGPEGEAMARSLLGRAEGVTSASGPGPGEGPSRQEREAGWFDLLFLGRGPDGEPIAVSVKGDLDPGYGATSRMVAQTALRLLREGQAVAGGIWTPGAALGDRLQDVAGCIQSENLAY